MSELLSGACSDCKLSGCQFDSLRSLLKEAMEALEFYGNPDTYFAIVFFPDPPCGEFMDDFARDHANEDYRHPMPGKRARSIHAKIAEAVKP